jgi:uncharacterized protein (TIGR02270 family)
MRPVPIVVQQHVEEAAHLRDVRSIQVRAPHVRLLQLGRLDERIAAHLDGIAVAGSYGSALCLQALEQSGKGQLFAATVRAIEDRDGGRLDALMAIAAALPSARGGLLSAFGWVSAPALRGITRALLDSPDPWRREVGLAACDLHGVNPGAALGASLRDAGLRPRALRLASRCGRIELREACVVALGDAEPVRSFEAAKAALLLGDRHASVAALEALALGPGAPGPAALCLLLKLVAPQRVHALLAPLSKDPARTRTLIRGIGAAGDPHYVPWLIHQMQDLKLARLAGEAFSLITGLDLAYLDLDRRPPEVGPGPDDDAADDDVAMDEDESLPWPDPEKIGAWWQANGLRFASGTRYFMGEVPSPAHCQAVLRSGFQRQRLEAAVFLCLMTPGTPLFNTAAPAWRQQRRLDAMGA